MFLTNNNYSTIFDGNTNLYMNYEMHPENKTAHIKTMIIITTVFGICWSFNHIFVLVCFNVGSSEELTMTSTT